MRKPTIIFNDIEYRKSHGTNPKGRGGWIFAIKREPAADEMIFTPSNSTYTEAKAYIKRVYTTLNAAFGGNSVDTIEFYTLP